jgi:hypothetical protein
LRKHAVELSLSGRDDFYYQEKPMTDKEKAEAAILKICNDPKKLLKFLEELADRLENDKIVDKDGNIES